MKIVPLIDVPSQSLSCALGGQSCQLKIYQRRSTLFADVYVDNTVIVSGAACRNAVPLVRSAYLGFIGDLVFYDTQGADDPLSPGLGARFILTYLDTE